MKPQVEAFADQNPGIKVVSYDVDQKGRGKMMLGRVLMRYREHVKSIPSVVVFKDGAVVASHTGELTAEEIEALVARGVQ